ncbi:GATA zinc finger domain-containing protein 24 [Quillaja saponaria]|uniref:GATA zinc finger domain-containing protein 24 n=1 Tax=Quillaja saponaria TaxID=32244 RepID=A0AAD7LKJ6_QUISA|nr:GATA zinc finger domain-containing protein 24 [Quillaja saponaria]
MLQTLALFNYLSISLLLACRKNLLLFLGSDSRDCEPESGSVYTGQKTSNRRATCVQNPAVQLPASSAPSEPVKSSSIHVYTRSLTLDKRKSKGKAIADPFISMLSVKILNSGDKSIETEGISRRKALTAPCRKKQCHMPSQHAFPQDFIEKQRACFAEVDAFELPEEEVASDEELE